MSERQQDERQVARRSTRTRGRRSTSTASTSARARGARLRLRARPRCHHALRVDRSSARAASTPSSVPADGPVDPRAQPLLVHGPLLPRRRDPPQGPVHGQVAALQAADAVDLHPRRRLPRAPRPPRRGGVHHRPRRSSTRGGCVAMYAEGGRSRTGRDRRHARPGIGRLALESGAPVVPVAIHGSSQRAQLEAPAVPEGHRPYGDPFRYERVESPRASSSRPWRTRSSPRSAGSTTASRPGPAGRARARRAPSGARGAPSGPPPRDGVVARSPGIMPAVRRAIVLAIAVLVVVPAAAHAAP